jgi:CRISPR system Cascade subunit CasE
VPYLSRVYLNPLRTGAQRLLANPQAAHAAVLGSLSRQPVNERTLWRLEGDTPHRAALLVLTHSRPSWEHVVEQAGWPGSDEPQALVRDYGALLDRVVAGREFAFRLRANTVSSTRQPDKATARQHERLSVPRARGVRVPERTANHQLAWFARRLPGWGFEVLAGIDGLDQLRLVARRTETFTKPVNEGARRRVTLQTAVAEGAVRVCDPRVARAALLDGCGPARAYGCGLLTLAPLTSATPPAVRA